MFFFLFQTQESAFDRERARTKMKFDYDAVDKLINFPRQINRSLTSLLGLLGEIHLHVNVEAEIPACLKAHLRREITENNNHFHYEIEIQLCKLSRDS